MPRNVGRHTGDKFGQPPQFILRIVEARDQQSHDLQPQTHACSRRMRVEDRLEPAAQFAVMAVVKALQINFVQIDPGPRYSSTCGVPLPFETNPVISPAALASLKMATAHSLVISGSL